MSKNDGTDGQRQLQAGPDDGSMLEIGVLCAHKLCGIKTFLPFVCEFCGKSFCDEHRNHGCALQQATLIKCASCKRNLRVGPGVDQDRVLAEHLASGKCIQKRRSGGDVAKRNTVERSYSSPSAAAVAIRLSAPRIGLQNLTNAKGGEQLFCRGEISIVRSVAGYRCIAALLWQQRQRRIKRQKPALH